MCKRGANVSTVRVKHCGVYIVRKPSDTASPMSVAAKLSACACGVVCITHARRNTPTYKHKSITSHAVVFPRQFR